MSMMSSRLPVSVLVALFALAACSDSTELDDGASTRPAGDGNVTADRARATDAAAPDAATGTAVGSASDAGRGANDASPANTDGAKPSSTDAAKPSSQPDGASPASTDGASPTATDASVSEPVTTVMPVNLGAAGNYAILAKTAVSTVPPSAVTGDVAVSPAAASYITGFSLTADSSNVFSTAAQVTGKVYAADYATPTPVNLTSAIGAMGLAFTDASGRAPNKTELGAGNIGGLTLAPGVYKWSSGLLIPTDVTLVGDANAVWIFQVAQGLTVSSGAKVVLTGGAVPAHVFWSVAGTVDVGTTAHLEGIVLGQTNITLRSGASINGRLLAQTAVTLDASKVVAPAAN